jgi:hypothetical protein
MPPRFGGDCRLAFESWGQREPAASARGRRCYFRPGCALGTARAAHSVGLVGPMPSGPGVIPLARSAALPVRVSASVTPPSPISVRMY